MFFDTHFKMKQILTIFILLFIYSCSPNLQWTGFGGHGLPSKDEGYEDLIFSNDSLGYLGGSQTTVLGQTGNKTNFTQKAILYKTLDKGKTWKTVPLDYKGGVEKIYVFKDTIVLLLQNVFTDTNYIVKSVDNGKIWKRIFTFLKDGYVRDIYFANSTSGKIIIDNRNKQYLVSYHDNKWDSILTLPINYFHHNIFENKVLSLITGNETANSKGILVTGMESKETKEIFFDKPYFIASTTKSNNDLFIAAQGKETGKILKFANNQIENIELGKFSDYMPDKIFTNGKTILAVAFRQKDVSFLGVIHSFLISKDNGKTWTLEELPNSLWYKPAFLYQDKFFISNALAGRFQIRTLE